MSEGPGCGRVVLHTTTYAWFRIILNRLHHQVAHLKTDTARQLMRDQQSGMLLLYCLSRVIITFQITRPHLPIVCEL